MCNLLPELVSRVSPDRGGLISSPGRKAGVHGVNEPPSILLPRGSPGGATERRSVAPPGLQKQGKGCAQAFPGLAPGARDQYAPPGRVRYDHLPVDAKCWLFAWACFPAGRRIMPSRRRAGHATPVIGAVPAASAATSGRPATAAKAGTAGKRGVLAVNQGLSACSAAWAVKAAGRCRCHSALRILHSALCTLHSALCTRNPCPRLTLRKQVSPGFRFPVPGSPFPAFGSYPQRRMPIRPCHKPSNSSQNRSKRRRFPSKRDQKGAHFVMPILTFWGVTPSGASARAVLPLRKGLLGVVQGSKRPCGKVIHKMCKTGNRGSAAGK
jgi:hypothetical protein